MDLATRWLSWTGLIGVTREEKRFHSNDFLKAESMKTDIVVPSFSKEDVARFYEISSK